MHDSAASPSAVPSHIAFALKQTFASKQSKGGYTSSHEAEHTSSGTSSRASGGW
jgi:hypothetical protein